MFKMKKTKFRKLSRVLISISLLAIIAVSLISVPVSAVGESVLGYWYIDYNELVNSYGNRNPSYYIDGFVNYPDGDGFSKGSIKRIAIDNSYSSDENIYHITIYFSVADGDEWQLTFGDGVVRFRDDNSIIVDTYSGDMEELEVVSTVQFTSEANQYSGDSLPSFYTLFSSVATMVESPAPPKSLLENIFGTFSEVGSWIGTIISSLVALFWSVETASLTFLGILSVAGLAFSVIMLLFGIVTRFVGFSG